MPDLNETLARMQEQMDVWQSVRGKDAGALLSAVQSVRALHQLADWDCDHTETRCQGCFEVYPCPTVRALTDALEASE